MNVNELFEGISDVVFHYTKLDRFFNIVNNGQIKLSPTKGHESNIDKGHKYFLSTSRSRLGSFHVRSTSGVLLTLDGRKLSHNLKGKSVDYWGGLEPNFDEMEDRVFSDKPFIEIMGYILKADVLLDNNQKDDEQLKEKLSYLKHEGFPIYVYDNRRNWISGFSDNALYTIKDGRFKVNLQMIMRRKSGGNP